MPAPALHPPLGAGYGSEPKNAAEWEEFFLRAGGPGRIPRGWMPQVKSVLVPDFIATLAQQGIACRDTILPASALRASQAELVEANVTALMGKSEQLVKPLLASQDGFVLDGHHRWEANRRLGREQPVKLLMTSAVRALGFMAEYAARHPDLCARKSA